MSEHDFPGAVTGLWTPDAQRRPGEPEWTETGIPGEGSDAPDEEAVADVEREAVRVLRRSGPRWVDIGGSGNTDSAGKAGFVLYTVAAGMELTLGWLLLSDDADAHTFGSPYSAGTDWVGVYRNGAQESVGSTVNDFELLLDGGPQAAGGPILPLKFEWGEPAAPRLIGPCSLVLRFVGDAGIASKRIKCSGQGKLARREGLE